MPNGTLNTSKGVVACRELLNCSEKESSKNYMLRKLLLVDDWIHYEKVVPSASHILTFNKLNCLEKIKAGFHRLDVCTLILTPLRCFGCQQFGHTAARCTRKQICICGESLYPHDPCRDPPVCVYCHGHHSVRSQNCPIYKEEVATQEVKTIQKVSYLEASKIVISRTPKVSSYAKVTAAPVALKNISEIAPILTNMVEQIINQKMKMTIKRK